MKTVPDSQQGYEDDRWSQYHGNDVRMSALCRIFMCKNLAHTVNKNSTLNIHYLTCT